MQTPSIESLYERAIRLNADAFAAQLYNAAYHALMTALELAQSLPSDQALIDVRRLADEQLAWIDAHQPEYKHSTQSTIARNGADSIFAHAAQRAATQLKIRKQRRDFPRRG